MSSRSNRAAVLAIAATVLCGCSNSSNLEAVFSGGKTDKEPAVELAGEAEPTNLAIFNDDASIKVGDSPTHALITFPEPLRGAYRITDLPYQFSIEKFKADGWETARGEGLGIIESENKVVGAIYELEHATQDTANTLLKQQTVGLNNLHAVQQSEGALSYWFWKDGDQTEMFCTLSTKAGMNVTIAVGDKNVMKALGVSQEDAKAQMAEVTRINSQPPIKPRVNAVTN